MSAQPKKSDWLVETFGNFTRKPVFFVDELMPHGKGIPQTFWKFTDIAWRNFLAPGKPDGQGGFAFPYEFRFTLEQLQDYHIHKKAARKWVAAYSASSLVSLTMGKRHQLELPGEPTVMRYHKAATKEDWLAFVMGLSVRCQRDRKNHDGGADFGFRAHLAHTIYHEHKMLGLPVDNYEAWFRQAADKRLIEYDGTAMTVKRTRSEWNLPLLD